MRRIAFIVGLLVLGSVAWADDLSMWHGTWVLREDQSQQVLTMTVEEKASGWHLTYKLVGRNAPEAVSTFVTQLDGKQVPVMIAGKSSDQTMGVKKLDSHHTITVLKFQGQPMGLSKSELSPDGKVIKTETDYAEGSPSGMKGKQVQYWDKK